MFTDIKTFITSNRDYRFLVEDPSSYLFSGLQRANSLKPDHSVSDANIKKSETAGCSYQSDKDAEELNHISINHWVKSANKSIENGDTRRHNNGGKAIQANNNTHSGTKSWQDGARPKYLSQQGGYV